MKVLAKTLLITLFMIMASFAGIIFYSKWKTNKENEIVYSDELEKNKGILKIRLGDEIKKYSNFDTMAAPETDRRQNVTHWVYCGNDANYNSVGGFYVRTLSLEKVKLDIENPTLFEGVKHAFGCSDKFIFIYTIKGKIAAIKVQLDEANGSNFNRILENIYGPTAHSNKRKNEIEFNIQNDQSVSWESSSVELVSKNIIVPRYSKNGEVYATDSYKELFYKYKPLTSLLSKSNSTKDETEAVKNSL